MYQTGGTIRKTLDAIHHHKLVLPAIQREFVWRSGRICRLFDSLMQGYPIGTFLYWQVAPENSNQFIFYDFVLDYHEQDQPHCPLLPPPPIPNQPLTVVLDGQQRLTALNIGLRGSMAWRLPYKWWKNPNAFPKRRLFLDLLWRPDEDDQAGLRYRFEFLTEDRLRSSGNGECWFPVGDVLAMDSSVVPLLPWLNQRLPQEKTTQALMILDRLHSVVHKEHFVAYYEEEEQELDRVLQIFIRMNDGGMRLSHSDLLFSIVVSQWSQPDAREQFHDLVDKLNGIGRIGFSFPRDLVLKASLMLSDIGSVRDNVDNFNRENVGVVEDKWNDIKRALTLTVQVVSSFGFNRQTLTTRNAILPIAYYLFVKNPGDAYLTHSRFEQDRKVIRRWLIQSLLKSSISGRGLDTLLTAHRRVIRESRENGEKEFPVAQIQVEMAGRGRSLVFEDSELENLANMRYSDGRMFALLSLIFPFVDLRNQFHIDHIFPRSRFTKRRLATAGVPHEKIDDFIWCRDGLANLQLLQGEENKEKRAKMPNEWLRQSQPDPTSRQAYLDRHLLGEIPDSITEFDAFYEARRERLKSRIKQLLGK